MAVIISQLVSTDIKPLVPQDVQGMVSYCLNVNNIKTTILNVIVPQAIVSGEVGANAGIIMLTNMSLAAFISWLKTSIAIVSGQVGANAGIIMLINMSLAAFISWLKTSIGIISQCMKRIKISSLTIFSHNNICSVPPSTLAGQAHTRQIFNSDIAFFSVELAPNIEPPALAAHSYRNAIGLLVGCSTILT
uniref:Uncharacterized protein n=1 Tax=Glossina pallidipes TaxID=7398 RepID=A0A1A9ZL77_GLOPL